MKSHIVVAVLLSALSVPAFAADAAAQAAKEMIPLTDGGTLYVFKDGRMAREDRFGRAVYQVVGTSVVAKDGRNIAVTSNEVARLSLLLQEGKRRPSTDLVCVSGVVEDASAPTLRTHHERERAIQG